MRKETDSNIQNTRERVRERERGRERRLTPTWMIINQGH